MAIQWGYHFITGLRNIDRQHESLVALVNKLDETVSNNAHPQQIEDAFGELTAYAREHFALEEQMMAEAGLDGAFVTAHKQAHEAFVHELTTMWQGREQDAGDTTKHLLEFLTTWIYRHILITDHEMARDYYQKKGLTAPPSLMLTTGGSR